MLEKFIEQGIYIWSKGQNLWTEGHDWGHDEIVGQELLLVMDVNKIGIYIDECKDDVLSIRTWYVSTREKLLKSYVTYITHFLNAIYMIKKSFSFFNEQDFLFHF